MDEITRVAKAKPLAKDSYNFVVNLLDGGFFGLALGFASYVSVIPLFLENFTSSALLIGLVPALHTLGWQLPQIFNANRLGTLRAYKPALLTATTLERLPFLALAILAWYAEMLPAEVVLVIAFGILILQSFAGGFAANPWQSMISKVIPSRIQGTFFGLQGGLANGLSALGVIAAGFILENISGSTGFSLTFLFAFLAMIVSFFFLALTKEKHHDALQSQPISNYLNYLTKLLRADWDFVHFIFIRNLLQFANLGINFYTIYVLRNFSASPATIGLMSGVFAATQIFANPILGLIGDRIGHRSALLVGAAAAPLGTLIALLANYPGWFYLSFALAGVGSVATWTVVITMTLKYGTIHNRPAYIGLSNTLTAPSTFFAPLLGGWLADQYGFNLTFGFTIIFGLIVILAILRLPEPSKGNPSRLRSIREIK
jgi:MFS family permease